LAGSALVETHDETQVSERRYLSEGSMAVCWSAGQRTSHTALSTALDVGT
jgi:hypothetical protein